MSVGSAGTQSQSSADVMPYPEAVSSRPIRKARAARRRKRRMDRSEHDLNDAQWRALKAEWGGCAYCRTSEASMQRDCVLPISWGGRYTIDNVVPACRSCNASKRNHEVTAWMRRRRFDERAFLKRHLAIQGVLAGRFEIDADTESADGP